MENSNHEGTVDVRLLGKQVSFGCYNDLDGENERQTP